MKNLKKNGGFTPYHFSKKNSAGFTLIEILVVIGIIAILAVIVLIAINPARQFQQARDTQRTSNVNAILNAIGQYVADNKGSNPASMPSPGATAVDAVVLCSALVPTYIPALPTDPSLDLGDIDNCTGAPNTGYDVSVNASSSRVTVAAPDAELTTIDVTR